MHMRVIRVLQMRVSHTQLEAIIELGYAISVFPNFFCNILGKRKNVKSSSKGVEKTFYQPILKDGAHTLG